MKIRPDCVAIGPPIFGVPKFVFIGKGIGNLSLIEPRGTSQIISPLSTLIAVNPPHGGGEQGAPNGDNNHSLFTV